MFYSERGRFYIFILFYFFIFLFYFFILFFFFLYRLSLSIFKERHTIQIHTLTTRTPLDQYSISPRTEQSTGLGRGHEIRHVCSLVKPSLTILAPFVKVKVGLLSVRRKSKMIPADLEQTRESGEE